jgi:hypothetical protein
VNLHEPVKYLPDEMVGSGFGSSRKAGVIREVEEVRNRSTPQALSYFDQALA